MNLHVLLHLTWTALIIVCANAVSSTDGYPMVNTCSAVQIEENYTHSAIYLEGNLWENARLFFN
jgi:hypothetical protein